MTTISEFETISIPGISTCLKYSLDGELLVTGDTLGKLDIEWPQGQELGTRIYRGLVIQRFADGQDFVDPWALAYNASHGRSR